MKYYTIIATNLQIPKVGRMYTAGENVSILLKGNLALCVLQSL